MTDSLLAECEALDAAYAAADDEAQRNAHPKVDVDLKWSLWAADEGAWLDYAPDAWRLLHAALTELPEGCSLTLRSAPRKEGRYGAVVIRHDDLGDLVADVECSCEWDEPRDLADTLLRTRLVALAKRPRRGRAEALRRLRGRRTEPTEAECEALAEVLSEAPLAAQVRERVVLPDTIDGSLAAIDAVETALLAADAEAWRAIEQAALRGDYDHVLAADVRPRRRTP